MAWACKATLAYTTFNERVHQLSKFPWTRRDVIVVDCPTCGGKYALYEEVDTPEADVEHHREFVAQKLADFCPDHPLEFQNIG